jgi:HSP20 family protein
MTLMLRDPFTDTAPLRQAMERLFEESFPRPSRRWLAVDVYETADALVIKAALPGLKPDEVDIAIDGDTLTITGEFKADEASTEHEYHRRELYVGGFERALRLPERFETEKAAAAFENGMLTLTVPKVERAAVRHIKVQPVITEAILDEIQH